MATTGLPAFHTDGEPDPVPDPDPPAPANDRYGNAVEDSNPRLNFKFDEPGPQPTDFVNSATEPVASGSPESVALSLTLQLSGWSEPRR